MAQIVKLRRSSVAGQKPTNANLQLGELAINTTDGKVFLAKSGSGGPSVEEIVTTNTVNTGSLNLIGSVTASEFSGSYVGDGGGLYNVPTASYSYTASYVLNIPQIGVEGSTQKLTVNTPSTTWNFNHGLGERYPAIQVFDGEGKVVIPTSIETIDENTLVIKFSLAQVGIATATIGGGLPAQSPSDEGYILRTNGSYSQWQSFETSGLAITGSNTFVGNQIITGSIDITGTYKINGVNVLTGSQPSVDSITFDRTAGINVTEGQMAWNNSDGTLDIGLNFGDVVLQVGQEQHFVVRNATGDVIENGTAVYASGLSAGAKRIEASPFTADGSVREVRFLGLATHDISNGVNGVVSHFGYVRGLDTRGTSVTAISVGDETWAEGDILYAHPTAAGKLTNVPPKHKIYVAIVTTRHQTTGVLFVRPSSYGHLDDVHDVDINTGSLSNGDLLVYNSTSENWENTKILSGSYEISGSLNVSTGLTVTGSLVISGGSVTMPDRPAFRVIGTGGAVAATTIISGSKVTVDYNQGNHYNQTTGLFTAPIEGLYQVNAVVRTNSNSLGTISQAIVYKQSGGNDTAQIMIEFAANTTMNHAGGSTISRLAVGDTLRLVVTVGALSFDGNDNFSVAYIG